MKCIAIIPARGGSKRILRKNIKIFLGHPIIKYSIDAALNAACFDEIMVSTDDLEIASIAKKYGARIPFMRSSTTSNDFATTAEVISEVLRSYKQNNIQPEYVCCIYPTAALITANKLRQAYQLLVASQAKSVIPVVRFGFPILRSFKIENELLKMNWPEYINTRSQDLAPAFHDCGQFYFLHVPSFLAEQKLFTDHTFPIEIPESEAQDIDNEDDWKIAELKYKLLNRE